MFAPSITYNGYSDGFHSYRINANCAGVNFVNVQKELTDWLFDEMNGEWFMGNEFPYPEHPILSLYNPNDSDTFIIMSDTNDIKLFENHFTITGIKVRDLL